MEKELFVIRGEDKRNVHLARMLIEDGYNVAVWNNSTAEQSIPSVDETQVSEFPCILVLTLTASQEELIYVLNSLCYGSVCFGGYANEEVKKLARDKNIEYYNILEYEPFSVLNSIPTAEGALMYAMQNTSYTLHGSRVAVLGFGRVGKAVAKIFDACSCETIVVCRSYEQLAYAQAYGYGYAHLSELASILKNVDIVLNTIPEQILDRQMLSALRSDVLIMELASGKNNIDYPAAKEFGLNVIAANGLPGKVAPVTAAKYIKETILHFLGKTR